MVFQVLDLLLAELAILIENLLEFVHKSLGFDSQIFPVYSSHEFFEALAFALLKSPKGHALQKL